MVTNQIMDCCETCGALNASYTAHVSGIRCCIVCDPPPPPPLPPGVHIDVDDPNSILALMWRELEP